MPTKRSAPKHVATPTPVKAIASRWITAAQHAELMALMADEGGSCRYLITFERVSGDHMTVEPHTTPPLPPPGSAGDMVWDGGAGDPSTSWASGSRTPLSPPGPLYGSNSMSLEVDAFSDCVQFPTPSGKTLNNLQWSGELQYNIFITPYGCDLSQKCKITYNVDSSFSLNYLPDVTWDSNAESKTIVNYIPFSGIAGGQVGDINPFDSYNTSPGVQTGTTNPITLTGRTQVGQIFVGHNWYQLTGRGLSSTASSTITISVSKVP